MVTSHSSQRAHVRFQVSCGRTPNVTTPLIEPTEEQRSESARLTATNAASCAIRLHLLRLPVTLLPSRPPSPRPAAAMSLPAPLASSAHCSPPHRLKKSRTELPRPLIKPSTPRLLTHSLSSPTAPRPADIDRLDEQLSAVTLRDSSILTLCDALTVTVTAEAEADSASRERRLTLVRGIRDKLIGSESNKALCVHFRHHRTLLALLAHSMDADDADDAELRLQLLTALSSLATGGVESQHQLQRDGVLDALFDCVRSGQQPLVDAAIVALRPLLLAGTTTSAQYSSAIANAFSHVDVVLQLISCFRHWQTHTSYAAAAALTALAGHSLIQQLCLIQHGLIPVLMSHLAAFKPSLPSQPVSAPFVASLGLLSALCHHNVYLVASLSLPASHPHTSASLLSKSSAADPCSLFPFAASLLLHPHADIRLHSASLLVRCVLAHVRLRRSKGCELECEERLIRDSELLRLHREWTASPMSKRGRAGNAKGGHKRQFAPLSTESFSLQQWISALQPLLLSCAVSSTSPFASAVTVLSPLLTRVLLVLVRLLENDTGDVAVEAVDSLCEVCDGWDCGHDELGDQLLSLTLARLSCCSATSPAPRGAMDLRPPLLRLLRVLCQYEWCRRAVLLHSMHWSRLIDMCDSTSQDVQCAATHVMGQLALSCRVQQAVTLSASSHKWQPFIALLVSRIADDEPHVSEAATYAVSCLLRPHAFRPLIVHAGNEQLLATLVRWTTAEELDKVSSRAEEAVSVLWQRSSTRARRRLHALAAIANLVFRCDMSMQKRAIDGLGGWHNLLAMLRPPTTDKPSAADDLPLCGLLAVVKQLVGAALRHEVDDEMYDWVAAKRQPAVARDAIEPLLTTDDLCALLSVLSPLVCSVPSAALLSSVLGVLVDVSSHPRGSAVLLLSPSPSSSSMLHCVLQGLRSSQTEHRELAVLVLYNALLLVVDDRQQRRDSSDVSNTELPLSRSTSKGGRSRATFGKRRRSTSRPTDEAISARRTRRRADGNVHSDSSARNTSHDNDGTEEAEADSTAGEDENADEQPEAAYLVHLSSTGVIAELLRLDESEVDGAVLSRVRRVLCLLRAIAAVSSSQSSKQLLLQLRALEVDVEEEGEPQSLEGEAEGEAEENEQQRAREMEEVRLRLTHDDIKAVDEGSLRVRWRSTMSGSRLGREEWMARHRALARVRETAELQERRTAGSEQQQQLTGDENDDEKQYDSPSGGSGEEESQEREVHAESRLLRQYVREWMTQPHALRANDADSVFGRLLAPFDSPSSSSTSNSLSAASAAASSAAAVSASPLRQSVQGVLSTALDRRSRHMRAMASAMGVRLADQQRSAQASSSSSRRGGPHR